ncbi:enoyl-CoA hydratase/isomerase family protein [Peristeroidobacter soli]|jgi:2-(1,2-epoxy-1,2-dihydrophenyl)acetyl-CoA isomerase|uniref:enoyl-CoA hydratase/isomerase family protein n=1 Tax=Peristeroidobacter soli TaxID=2497877 RepID=UPI00101B5BCF|nr:enoyl-CoA hydratase/isomerase family protein [Peristeroidobacter soli]
MDITPERTEGVTLLRFNRPQCLNAFSRSMYGELEECIARFGDDDSQRVLVLTGAGRAFSAGQDLNDVDSIDRSNVRELTEKLGQLQRITRRMQSINKPIVAAINGPAVGFGAELTLSCDIRLAAPGAYFMFPELQRGLFFTNGSLMLLPRLIGFSRATHLLLTGERWSAEAGREAGLIARIVPDEELLEVALKLARQLSQLDAESVRLTLAGLRLGQNDALEAAMSFEIQACLQLMRRADSVSGEF